MLDLLPSEDKNIRIVLITDLHSCWYGSGQKDLLQRIDREYPEYLSTAYMVFCSPKSSCYLPVPVTIDELPDELMNGKYSERAFARKDKKQPFLPEKELKALESKLYKRHAEAVEAARRELHRNADRSKVAEILKKAFQQNWADIIAAEKMKVEAE